LGGELWDGGVRCRQPPHKGLALAVAGAADTQRVPHRAGGRAGGRWRLLQRRSVCVYGVHAPKPLLSARAAHCAAATPPATGAPPPPSCHRLAAAEAPACTRPGRLRTQTKAKARANPYFTRAAHCAAAAAPPRLAPAAAPPAYLAAAEASLSR
jgi:hypothetical protein